MPIKNGIGIFSDYMRPIVSFKENMRPANAHWHPVDRISLPVDLMISTSVYLAREVLYRRVETVL